ncbi:olfactory receptor 5F1-like [Betta splendens]|uniref:Olfactory receptor 5F1-like n=1 Tax=Betta splendens TaxID=158456 RepID=A0A6P7PBX8_BETSP|nr:olfactory receptor 5F1-like [Betta splendens]
MENQTQNLDVLQLEGLNVRPQFSLLAFVLLLLLYTFIVVSNLSLIVLVSVERSLHQSMYLLFCNMSINDVFGATAVLPRLLADMLTPVPARCIHYVQCAVQAFAAHFHAGTSHAVLTIMALDRYVAICCPLRYAAIMTGGAVLRLSVGAWAAALLSVAVLMALSVRLSRCRRFVANPFCDNASLFKLSCENVLVNHVYGLASGALFLCASLGAVCVTYARIAAICLSSRSRALKGRALHTCATHLAAYVIMLVSSLTPMIIHRNPEWADGGKVASVLFFVVPPVVNPVIYGLHCKELRHRLLRVFHRPRGPDTNMPGPR